MANGVKKKSQDEKALATLSEWERLASFKNDFLLDWKADAKFRKNAERDGKFYDGDQWDSEEKRILESRNQPAVVINRIKSKVDGIHGIQLGTSVDTKAFPSGNRELEAEVISERLRNIEDESNFDDQESEACLDALIEGRFWYRIKKCWDGLKVYHKITREPLEDWVKDRDSRKADLSDASRVQNTMMVKLSDLKKMFPSKAKELEKYALKDDHISLEDLMKSRRVRPDQYKDIEAGNSDFSETDHSIFCDEKNRQVRVVTTYYRTKEIKKFYYQPKLPEPIEITGHSAKDLDLLMQSFPEGEIIEDVKLVLNAYTFTWNVELELKENIRPYDYDAKFPVVMGYAYAERGDGTHYGVVRQMIDPQTEYNKRRSKLLHLLNVNRIRYTEGAFEHPEQARLELTKPDGFQEQKPGSQVIVENNLDVSGVQFQLLQQAGVEIDTVGTAKEVEGKSSASSGKELQLRQQIATQPIRKIFNAIRDARRRVGLYLVDDIVREINEELAAAGAEAIPVSKYDIVVEEAPDTLNLQSETFDRLVQLASNGLPVPIEMILEFSPMPKKLKEETLGKMQAQQQAQQAALAAGAQQGASAEGAIPVQ